jgi:hypothetical protein
VPPFKLNLSAKQNEIIKVEGAAKVIPENVLVRAEFDGSLAALLAVVAAPAAAISYPS